MEKGKWTAIVLTCFNKNWTYTLQNELQARQAKGQIDKDTILLTVEDPKTNVGSGGATINALLTVAEHISARQGFTGTSFCYDPCGRPFVVLPAKFSSSNADGLVYNIDILIKVITEKIAVGAPAGVWVSSLDMLLSIPSQTDVVVQPCDACLLTVPAKIKYAKDHGVCKMNTQGMVEDILFQSEAEVLERCQSLDGTVPVICGIVYLSANISEKILSFYHKQPLDACTYFGVDSGQPPLKLSLFFDVLLPMTTAVSESDFIQGQRSSSYGRPAEVDTDSRADMAFARKLLWKELHGYRLRAVVIEGGRLHYLSNLASQHKKILLHPPVAMEKDGLTWANTVQADIQPEVELQGEVTVINSLLKGPLKVGSKTAITHSCLSGNIGIGNDSLISGVSLDQPGCKKRIQFADSMVIQGFNIFLKTLGASKIVLTVHGRFDNIKAPTWQNDVTFCNDLWLQFLKRTGISNEDLWGTEIDRVEQTVYNARLFPVFHTTANVGQKEILWLQGKVTDTASFDILKRWKASWRLSMAEIQSIVDMQAELTWRKTLFYKVAATEVKETLLKSLHFGFNHLFTSAAVDGFSSEILSALDDVASKTSDPGIAARTMANIADVMGCMAQGAGGLRSGPAANPSWKKAFNLLEKKNFVEGVAALAKERGLWLGRPDLLIRGARHYEGAAQILIRQAVMTAKQYFTLGEGQLPALGKWVQADCPARIDVAGGWSDTPPITYEHGGAVTIVGVLINGKRPIGCRVRRIEEPIIRMELVANGEVETVVMCKQLSDLEDYFQPHAPGALLKAAFVCCDMVSLTSSLSLAEQLKSQYQGGFEMQSWSNLPHGSGMGTSSILAGAVLAALLTAGGKTYEVKGLIHAVLYLEQLLTTGGGWQDQIGGLMGGIHLGLSEAKLPLEVQLLDLNIPQAKITEFNSRLLLIYTGKTRLARNLLQDVVRNWYARNPHIVSTEDSLVLLAQTCSTAFIEGNFDHVGDCVEQYWEMKKRMAPGCESHTIALIMKTLKPYMLGMCSAGAGGGGFIFGILRDPGMKKEAVAVLGKKVGLEEAVVYEAEVDMTGLTVSVEP